MEPETIIGGVTILGALMGTFVPYLMKVWQKNSQISFDMHYAYALIIGVVVQAAALLPDSVPALTVKSTILAFSAGYGLQTIINKMTPRSS